MDHIFGDSQDIDFGSTPSRPAPAPRSIDRILPARGTTSARESAPMRAPTPRVSHPAPVVPPRERAPRPPVGDFAPSPQSTLPALTRLVGGMKSSFLPIEDDSSTVRLVSLSSSSHRDPLMLMRRDDATILIGSGFDTIYRSGKAYPTFPDMRLIVSEKTRLQAWVITDTSIDITLFQSILPTLEFPPIYAPRAVIAKFRDTITDTSFLDQCRFFELFADGGSSRKIGAYEFGVQSSDAGSHLSLHTP
jgi:hypothetical protein